MTLLEALQRFDESTVAGMLELGILELTGAFRGLETEVAVQWAEAS